jgi:hypothetical protein
MGRTHGHQSRNLLSVWMKLFRQHTEGSRRLGLFGILKQHGVTVYKMHTLGMCCQKASVAFLVFGKYVRAGAGRPAWLHSSCRLRCHVTSARLS